MIYWRVNELIREKGLTNPNIFQHLDGDGVGNAGVVERMERPKEGGILVYFYGYKYPYKGTPHADSVNQLGILKRAVRYLVEAVQKNKDWRLKVFLAPLILLPEALTKSVYNVFIDFAYRFVEWLIQWELLKPNRYSTCVRELYRASTKVAEREKDEHSKKLIWLLRDVLCLIIEIDSAYRFRFQDIIAEAKPEELKADKQRMISELKRLFAIANEREGIGEKTIGEMRNKWIWLKNNLCFALNYVKPITRVSLEIFKELDYERLKPDDADRYYMMMKKDYFFFGKPLPERIEMRKQIEGDNWVNFQEVGEGFLKEWEEDRRKLFLKEAQESG